METGKTGKYFKYAIGEIILVVIGILIALSINNWNQAKKAKEKEQHALTEILSDLDFNIDRLKGIINSDDNSIEVCINSINVVIKNLEETKSFHDSLTVHFSQNFYYPDFDLKTSGYESLSSIGMDLISDNKLRSEIGKLYTYQIPSVRGSFNELRDDFYNYMLDFLRREFIAKNLPNGDRMLFPKDYKSITINLEYLESLKAYKSVFSFYGRKSLQTKLETEKLKQLIKNYLNEN